MSEVLKLENEGLAVEFEVIPAVSENDIKQSGNDIDAAIKNIDNCLNITNKKIEALNSEIDRLTNHADGFDYMVAVSSGILAGLIDSFFVGDFDFKNSKANAHKKINDYILKKAKASGFKGDRLDRAIAHLEDNYKVKQDNAWSGANIGVSAKSHHLDDLAHHPSLLGLLSAVIVEFLGIAFFQNKKGEYHFKFVGIEPEKLIKRCIPIVISGIFMWLINVVESHLENEFDEEIPAPIRKIAKLIAAVPAIIPILKIAHNWAMHLVSDMGGSKNTPDGGMGIPGFFLSFLKELSMIPGLNMTGLPKLVNELYEDKKFDLRSEIAVLDELKRQAIPVIINEIIVRCFYFVRHLAEEIKTHNDMKQIEWNKIIPFRNRTIVRMMTISTGTMTAVDLADAAIRSAAKSGGNAAVFAKEFILKVNFVGVGRFAIAAGTDIGMGIKRNKLRNERMQLYTTSIRLLNAKVYYCEANMWIAAEDTGKSIEEAYQVMIVSVKRYQESIRQISEDMKKLDKLIPEAEKNNPGLTDDIYDILKWG